MADKTGYIGRNPGDSSVKVARQTFTPSTATTDFTFASGYTVGYLDLYLNGAKLIEGTDYNANNGVTISMVSDAQSGDVLEAVAYKAFNVGDSSSSSTGNFTVGNDLTVDNNATITNDLNVLGIGTVAKGFNVSAGGANISGVVTATSYQGDGSALTGIAATDYIAAASLTVSGITTLTGAVQAKSTTESTTKDTGALIVEGGVGIEKNLNLGTTIKMDSTAGVVTATTFKGNVTGNVTGNTSGTAGGLTGTPSVTVNLLTATDVNVGGALTVGGVLTYEDVTNVDSIGIITARAGVRVSSGGIQAVGIYTGLKAGISTFSNDISIHGTAGVGAGTSIKWNASANKLRFNDNTKAEWGDGSDLAIFHNATDNIIDCLNDKNLKIVNDSAGGNETMIECDPNGSVDLFFNGSKKLETTNSGLIVTGVCTAQVPAAPLNDASGTYTLVASDAGKVVVADNTITVDQNVFSPGDLITVMNDTASTMTLTQGSGVTLRKAGTADTGSLTISVRGVITIICLTTTGFFVCGNLE